MCPICHGPSRRTMTGRGRQPVLCVSCLANQWKRQHAKRKLRPSRVSDDIPADEIERRYQVALAEIRRQRWDARL